MKTYYQIAKFNLVKNFAYPAEVVAFIFNRFLEVALLLVLWGAIYKTNPNQFNFRLLISYFFMSQGIKALTFSQYYRFGRNIQKAIKSGELNNYLLKPVGLVSYLFSNLYIGKYGMSMLSGALFLLLGIGIAMPVNIMNIVWFVVLMVPAVVISISFNLMVACLQFYTTESGSIRSVLSHITNFLSGGLIPLEYFKGIWKQIAYGLPFFGMVYGPIAALQGRSIGISIWVVCGVAYSWSIILYILAKWIWNKSLKKYDATGI